MASPLVVPSVCRYSVNATYIGKPVTNVVDLSIVGDSRAEDCHAGGEILAEAWETRILPRMQNVYLIQDIKYVDLHSLDGPTGVITSGGGDAWPLPGAIGGEAYAGAMSTLVRKNGASQRGVRAGRMFLCPPGETMIAGNELVNSYVLGLNNDLEDFIGDVTFVDTNLAVFPVTVHLNAATGVYFSDVITSMTTRSRLSTQRQRGRP